MSKVIFPFQSECIQVLGNPSNSTETGFNMAWFHSNVVYVACPWQLTDYKHHFGHIAIHKFFASSLAEILGAIWEGAGKSQEKIDALKYNVFSGSACYRNMRTHHSLSMHAFASAIDFDAPDNMLGSARHLFKPDDLLPVKFKEAGWTRGMDWQNNSVDAMHFQGPRVG